MEKITIYTTDAQDLFSDAVEVDPRGPVPRGLLVPPPELRDDEVAQAQGGTWVVLPQRPRAPFDRAAAGRQIDDAVAAIYARPYRFVVEYEERETQARAFKDAGYLGPVPPRVAEFATPAGLPPEFATDLILSQAANLRTAQAALSALRMRKYEVLNAASDAAAAGAAAEILAAIAVVDGQVT